MIKDTITGCIFDIQHYCIHDGPGIRTGVFFKGCPLHCLWCQNPESQKAVPQIMYDAIKCSGCGNCVALCPEQAIIIRGDISVTDRTTCTNCGKCVDACLPKARTLTGREVTVEDVLSEVEKDRLFYGETGGVTLTGGELLMQSEFSTELLRGCKKNGITTAIETSGYSRWEALAHMLQFVDTVIYDIKHMDDEKHRRCTGVGNSIILENAKRISSELTMPIWIRTPVIPGYNDDIENFRAMGMFIKENLPTCVSVELLPYHSLGESKKEQLEREDIFASHTPEHDKLVPLMNVLAAYGIKVV